MEKKSQKREGVVCFLQKDERYLLTLIEYSQTDRKWNGIGGFIQENESLTDAVIREMQEEVSITPDIKSLKHVGKIIENNNFTLHVFIANGWHGTLEIKDKTLKQLQWFTPNEIPYGHMWPDNTYWLPAILSGKKIFAEVLRDVYMDIKPLSERDVQITEVADLN